jgi:hypothetical protein
MISKVGRLLSRRALTVAPAAANFLEDLATMDYAFRGAPFVEGPVTTDIDLATMDYTFRGAPFVIYKAVS